MEKQPIPRLQTKSADHRTREFLYQEWNHFNRWSCKAFKESTPRLYADNAYVLSCARASHRYFTQEQHVNFADLVNTDNGSTLTIHRYRQNEPEKHLLCDAELVARAAVGTGIQGSHASVSFRASETSITAFRSQYHLPGRGEGRTGISYSPVHD